MNTMFPSYRDWFINFKSSLRAFSRTTSSDVLSMCILIFFPLITLLFTPGPSSPLEEEEEKSSSDWFDLYCLSFDRSRCFFDDFFLSLLLRFRWRSSFFLLLLLLDRLFFLCFFDLLRSRSFEQYLSLLLLLPEDIERDLDLLCPLLSPSLE